MDNVTQQPQATPDQPAAIPVESLPENKSYKKIIVLFIIILLLLGSGTYLVLNKNVLKQKSVPLQATSPTPAANQTSITSNWKTYTSNTYHFSIQYPHDWTLDEQDGRPTFYPPGVTRGIWEAALTPIPGGDPSISIYTLNRPFSQSDSQNEELVKNQCVQDFEIITVDGKQGYYYQLIGCGPIALTSFDLPYENGNKILQLQLFSMHQEDIDSFNRQNKTNIKDADAQTFKKMIKTITFTTKTQTMDTTNWKTYTDSVYGYTLQYPAGWILKQEKASEGDASIKLTSTNATKAAFSARMLPELYITVTSPYSTSGVVCANQYCTQTPPPLKVIIKGQESVIPITKGEVVQGSDKQFDFYAFSFPLPGKKVSIQGYSEPIQLNAIASYKTTKEGQEIGNILSTLIY